MKIDIDIVALIIGIVPAIISYFVSVNKSNNRINSIQEETEKEIKGIKADTEREIEKIKADTEREIEKINADTESQIKLMEAKSKISGDDKLNEMMLEKLGGTFMESILKPENIENLNKLGENKDKDMEIISKMLSSEKWDEYYFDIENERHF